MEITHETYKKVLNKIFSALRFVMYQKVKLYWDENSDGIQTDFNKLRSLNSNDFQDNQSDENAYLFSGDEEQVPISRETILLIAENIDKGLIYQKVL